MSSDIVADTQQDFNQDVPSELSEHASPPADRPALVAWLRAQALRHADLAERRPWERDYHLRMARDASACAAYYEEQAREAATQRRRGGGK